MFFGLVLKANRKYTQTIKKAFHLSQAALDITSCGDEPIQLVLISDKTSYILCTLRKKSVEQVSLDLNFAEGDEISFLSQGNGNVHLSGYLVDEDFLGGEDEDEEDEVTANLKEASKKQKKNSKTSDDDDDDSDDDDGELELGDSDEEAGDEEGDDDDDDDNEEGEGEEDEDDSDEDSEDEVKEPAPKKGKLEKPKQNGVEKPEKPSKKDKKNKEQQQKQKNEKILQGGVKIEDLRVGNGPEAKAGKKISVYYEGRLKSNNKVFDSTKQGNGFKFALGNGDVIKGWDVGVVGMKVGGKRRITCPPNAAYGAKGSPPVIPPNSTLVFEVELKTVH